MGRMHTQMQEEIERDLEKDLEKDLEEYLEVEREDRRTAIRRLLAKGLKTWRREESMESNTTGERAHSHGSQQGQIDRCGISLDSQKSEI